MLGCTRADLPPVQWDVDEGLLAVHMGRWRGPEEEIDPRTPPPHDRALEAPEDGCPGGDLRCRFTQTLMRYYRHRDDNGNRIDNPHLRYAPEQVIDAILFFETEEAECQAYGRYLARKKAEAKRGA